MKKWIKGGALSLAVVVALLSCRSAPAVDIAAVADGAVAEEAAAFEPLVLEEVFPPEIEVVAVDDEEEEIEIEEIWVDFGVLEVESDAGVQRRIISYAGDQYELIRIGMTGVVYGDRSRSELAGDITVTRVSDQVIVFEIGALNFSIDRNALVSVQIQ